MPDAPHDGPTPELLWFRAAPDIPNNPVLPVVLLRGAVPPGTAAEGICDLYRANGWRGAWVWSVFTYHHYHPDAHEVLTVASGEAELLLGGADVKALRLVAGDMLVLPAGTGHRNVAASQDFAICGAYPPDQENFTTNRAAPGAPGQDAATIARVPLPETDPIFGTGGPLTVAWQR